MSPHEPGTVECNPLSRESFCKMKGHSPSPGHFANRVLAETECDFSASENVTDSPTTLVRIPARMGKSGTTNKCARNGRSGDASPERTMTQVSRDSQDDDGRSSPSEDG